MVFVNGPVGLVCQESIEHPLRTAYSIISVMMSARAAVSLVTHILAKDYSFILWRAACVAETYLFGQYRPIS